MTIEDVTAEGVRWDLPRPRADRVVRETVEAVWRALADLDRGVHPGVPDAAWEVLETRLSAARQRL